MAEVKFKTWILSVFFFFQGVFLTGLILLMLFDNKFIPVIKEKNIIIESLVDELNGRNYKNYNHTENVYCTTDANSLEKVQSNIENSLEKVYYMAINSLAKV